jgi:anti-anti-sigma regulatory factor
MASGLPPQAHYLVAASQQSFYIRVVGLATMMNCIHLQEVLAESRRQGYRQFIFDLAQCSGFDSTFMGVLLGLTRSDPGEQPPRADAASVLLVNSSVMHARLLAEVGLDRVIRLHGEPIEFPPVELRRLEEGSLDPERRIRSVVAAHENLVRLGGPNIEKFGALLAALKRELGGDAAIPG